MTIKGIIFDFDGTLADTFPLIFLAFGAALRKYTGRNFSNDEISKYFGPSEDGIFQRIVPEHWQEAMELYLTEYKNHHSTHARLFPGMLDLLKLLQDKPCKLAIITGKGRDSFGISVACFDLREYFEVLVPGSPEQANKDVNIRRVVSGWGFEPREVVYVGDTGPDIIAARAAGVVSVGVYWDVNANLVELQAENPAVVFESLSEFRNWLIQQID